MNGKTRSYRLKLILICLAFVLLITLIIFLVAAFIHSRQAAKITRVKGIDVSAYQGEIDWKEIEKQDIYFAYIKATEGDDYLDSEFKNNWKNIDKTKIYKGAYLYYDFSKDGDKTADYYIENVPAGKNMLPPAVDVEIPDNDSGALPDKNKVISNISKIITKLKEHYGQDPIIYTNMHTYSTYFSDKKIKDIKFWICDVSSDYPELSDSDWVFWQYTWRGVLDGVGEDQLFTDCDLFNGNLQDFNRQFDHSLFSRIFN